MTVDFEKLGVFYLGRNEAGEAYLYESKHLVTHGVVIGMTGSGKTGLAVGLLEEAAIDGVPAIVIDPKGDLSNLLLTFPDLSAEQFAPWVAEGKDPQAEADAWKAGLGAWGQDGDRIKRLREAATFTVYTPGSTAGVPVSILASLQAPSPPLEGETLRDRIASVSASLLGLLGIEADPVKSREHILLQTILANHWAKGLSLDLGALIMRISDPKISKIGVLDLETFYPQKERFELAIQFNNLLASPGFETWLEGEPLNVGRMLRDENGKPRISIFSISHLGDQERMFFVTLLLGQMVAWMRSQSGTTSLRALLYMDEIFGYFPPVANPPSKQPLLTLLKQARAFGLGVVLASQNPVDLDYKGLANAGSWFIGRLQTERDKARVIEGLEGAAAGSHIDKDALGRLLSGLKSRQFLVHNVHSTSGPQLIDSRWTLSYLRGPLTKEHLAILSKEPKARLAAAENSGKDSAISTTGNPTAQSGATVLMHPATVKPANAQKSRSANGEPLPAVAQEIPQVFLGTSAAILTPHVVGAAIVRIEDRKSDLSIERRVVFAAALSDGPVPLRWDDAVWITGDVSALSQIAPEDATAAALPAIAQKPKSYVGWQKDFVSWLVANQGVSRLKSLRTGLLSALGEDESAFRGRLAQTAREERDRAVQTMRAKYTPKFDKLREQIRVAQAAAEDARSQASHNDVAQGFGVGASILGAIFGHPSAAGIVRVTATAARGTVRARAKSQSAGRREEMLSALQGKWTALEAEFQESVQKQSADIDAAREELTTVVVKPKKTGIQVEFCGLLWK